MAVKHIWFSMNNIKRIKINYNNLLWWDYKNYYEIIKIIKNIYYYKEIVKTKNFKNRRDNIFKGWYEKNKRIINSWKPYKKIKKYIFLLNSCALLDLYVIIKEVIENITIKNMGSIL
jgi:hypothetical protein